MEADTDRKVYEFTNSMFDQLEARGIEIDEPLAAFVRACAVQAVEVEEWADLWLGGEEA